MAYYASGQFKLGRDLCYHPCHIVVSLYSDSVSNICGKSHHHGILNFNSMELFFIESGLSVPRSAVTEHKISFWLCLLLTLILCLFIQGEELLRKEDIVSLIEEQGESIALLLFSGQY